MVASSANLPNCLCAFCVLNDGRSIRPLMGCRSEIYTFFTAIIQLKAPNAIEETSSAVTGELLEN